MRRLTLLSLVLWAFAAVVPPAALGASLAGAPTLSPRLIEGNAGVAALTFTVTLSRPSTSPVTVTYATANGTATAGVDYTAVAGTLTFLPGETAKAVTVSVIGDTLLEPDETLYLRLSSPAGGATIADGQGTGTIVNDDAVPPVLPVVWANSTGATASGNDLTKTSAAGWGNAGAASAQSLLLGDGAVQVTAAATTGNRVFGLSRGSTTDSYQEIDHAFYLASGGPLGIVENGQYRGTVGVYSAGDALAVVVQAGVVYYLKNGVILYASAVPAAYPLLVDAALYDPGSALVDAVVYGAWAPPAAATQPVVFTGAGGVTVAGGSLVKTATAGWGNAGAVSTLSLASGDGGVETAAGETTYRRMFGLGRGNSTRSYEEIDYAFYLMDGAQLRIYENGVSRGAFGSYAPGDKLRVAVQSGVVRYFRNGVLLYESGSAPAYPLLLDTALYDTGATVLDARLVGTWR